MYDLTIEDMLAKWDDSHSIWSIEMGGLGPGYEQAIQVLMVELCRGHLAGEEPEEVVRRNSKSCGGFSGAQVGAAKSIAMRFCEAGPKVAIEDFKQKVGNVDRVIQVSSFWPQASPVTAITTINRSPKKNLNAGKNSQLLVENRRILLGCHFSRNLRRQSVPFLRRTEAGPVHQTQEGRQ